MRGVESNCQRAPPRKRRAALVDTPANCDIIDVAGASPALGHIASSATVTEKSPIDRTSYFLYARDSLCPSTDAKADALHGRAVTTRDHDVITHWAERHQPVPATREAIAFGPATASVTDGGTAPIQLPRDRPMMRKA
jgi:hypothetical protein